MYMLAFSDHALHNCTFCDYEGFIGKMKNSGSSVSVHNTLFKNKLLWNCCDGDGEDIYQKLNKIEIVWTQIALEVATENQQWQLFDAIAVIDKGFSDEKILTH